MVIQCPACRKVNSNSHSCERCGCDLSLLGKIREAAEFELGIGSAKLKRGAGAEALGHAERSWFLKKSDAAAKLGFLACILSKNFREAPVWYNRATCFHGLTPVAL